MSSYYDLIRTCLTIVAMLMLVLAPLLIPLAVTGCQTLANRWQLFTGAGSDASLVDATA
jgi:hypothetical protein